LIGAIATKRLLIGRFIFVKKAGQIQKYCMRLLDWHAFITESKFRGGHDMTNLLTFE
jgi:hypothetical protein